VEEPEDVGAERRPTGVAAADAGEAQLVPYRAQRHHVGHEVYRPPQDSRLVAFQLRLGESVADGLAPGERLPLEPAGFPDPHHDRAEHVLPDAGRAEHHVGAQFAQVGALRGRLLGEAEGDPGRHGVGHRNHLLADPGQGEEAQVAVLGTDRIDFLEGLAHHHQVGVRQHGELGAPGGARRGADHRNVSGAAGGNLLVEPAGVGFAPFAAVGLDGGELDQVGHLVHLEAAGVVVDDLLDRGQPVLQLDDLVDLLLVLGHDDLDLAVGENVDDLLPHARRVDPDGAGAE
jgi:hypothetical protein